MIFICVKFLGLFNVLFNYFFIFFVALKISYCEYFVLIGHSDLLNFVFPLESEKEKYVLDSLFVNRFQGKVKGRNDGVVTEREPHDLQPVFIKDRRLARIVAQIIDRHALRDAIDCFDRTRVWAATQIESSV